MARLTRSLHACPGPGAVFDRRGFLQAGALAGLSGLSWMTPLSRSLAYAAEEAKAGPAQSLIVLWMGGGPSQIDTFDPHPAKLIGGGVKAIETRAKGVQIAEGLEHTADVMDEVALIRSVVSPEGDHERGASVVRTGYRPIGPDAYPMIGAVLCHELPEQCDDRPFRTEIPRHVSILPGQWPAVGGFLGAQYDAFKCHDPKHKVPDVTARVDGEHARRRLDDLNMVEQAFARRRAHAAARTRHTDAIAEARRMMASEQLQAFEVEREPVAVRAMYGDTEFGRACLAARRLTDVGVRCVEVTLDGWDTHLNNTKLQQERKKILDPAFAALIRDLKEHGQLERTIVLLAGEFGRTPKINGVGGRDHWPHGFSIALAGGRIRGGAVLGETDPEGGKELVDPIKIADVHATIFRAFGLNPAKENTSPAQRAIKLAEGTPVEKLLT